MATRAPFAAPVATRPVRPARCRLQPANLARHQASFPNLATGAGLTQTA
jgi:hypothetical protein